MKQSKLLLSLLFSCFFIISGCIDFSDSSSGESVTAGQVTGIAATGAAAAGKTVYLSDINGVLVSAVADNDGKFVLDVTGLTEPFIIWFEKDNGAKLFSAAFSSGTANVNPATNAIIRSAYAVSGGTGEPLAELLSKENCELTETGFKSMLAPIFDLYGVDHSLLDIMSAEDFAANGQGIDGVFDDFHIEVQNGILMVTSKADTSNPVLTVNASEVANAPVTVEQSAISETVILRMLNAAAAKIDFDSIKGENTGAQAVNSVLTLFSEGVNGTSAAWSSSDSEIISNSGAVTQPVADTQVTLTLTLSKAGYSVTKEFALTVTGSGETGGETEEPSDAEAVAETLASLTFDTIKGENIAETSVSSPLILPVSGENDTTISWSSDSSVISANGTVTRPAFLTGDATVTLTATVSKGDISDTKSFTLTVPKLDITDAESAQVVAAAKTALTFDVIKGSNSLESNVTAALTLPLTGDYGTAVSWSSDSSVISESGAVTRPAFLTGDVSVTLTATIANGNVSDTKDFALTVPKLDITDAESAQVVSVAKTALTFDVIKGLNSLESSVTAALTLPLTGVYGTTVSWSSNNSAVSASGTVTRPAFLTGDATVTLTATITNGSVTDTKDFALTVPKLDITDAESAQVVAAAKTALTFDVIKGLNTLASDVISTLMLPLTGDYGTTISWSSNNSAISASGTVTRPAFLNGNASVTFTATITNGNVSDTKDFALTVTKLDITADEQAVINAEAALSSADFLGNNSAANMIIFDMSLPSAGADGTSISWASDNETYLDNAGFVQRPDISTGAQQAVLTATISKGSASLDKAFTFEVPSVIPKKISSGNTHTVMIKEDGTLWGWGENTYGQLGTGSNSSTSVTAPVREFNGFDDWVTVTAGTNVTAAIRANGTLWLWGLNNYGQLANGNRDSVYTPVQESLGATDWIAVEAGSAYILALRATGEIYGWGANNAGQLGTGATDTYVLSPVSAAGGASDWAVITAGHAHAAAIKTDGTLWTWGDNGSGELGISTLTRQLSPMQEYTESNLWTDVSAGTNFTTAIRSNGTLWGWGKNSLYQIGSDAGATSTVPRQEETLAEDWAAVDSGVDHTAAIKQDGRLYSFGNNTNAQLGTVTAEKSFTALQEATLSTAWTEVSAGNRYSAALRSDNTVWAWGYNGAGQIGNGDDTTPVSHTLFDSISYSPLKNHNKQFVEFDISIVNSCGIDADGGLWCIGGNTFGQIGDGTTAQNKYLYTQIKPEWTWSKVSLGLYHTAAIRSDGTIWSWGSGTSGQIGNGASLNVYEPTQESSDSAWIYLSAGDHHTSAIRSDGTLWSWGSNSNCELSACYGYTENQNTPVQDESGITNWVQISSSKETNAGVTANGRLYTWGLNSYGQINNTPLGAASFTAEPEPTGAVDWTNVAVGTGHVVGVKSDGSVWTWGRNSHGQLCQGTGGPNLSTPTEVTINLPAASAVEAYAAGDFTIIRFSNGELYSCGDNGEGQLGIGASSTSVNTLTHAGAGNTWSRIATASGRLEVDANFTQGLTADGELFGWGGNIYNITWPNYVSQPIHVQTR